MGVVIMNWMKGSAIFAFPAGNSVNGIKNAEIRIIVTHRLFILVSSNRVMVEGAYHSPPRTDCSLTRTLKNECLDNFKSQPYISRKEHDNKIRINCACSSNSNDVFS